MDISSLDIERIVREVIAELKASAAGSVQSSAPSRSCVPSATPTGVRNGDTIHCSQRVVTVATLDGKLDGIRHFIARKGAVITPSVKDLFRDRGIDWRHAEE